jgi:hypothetical protein
MKLSGPTLALPCIDVDPALYCIVSSARSPVKVSGTGTDGTAEDVRLGSIGPLGRARVAMALMRLTMAIDLIVWADNTATKQPL